MSLLYLFQGTIWRNIRHLHQKQKITAEYYTLLWRPYYDIPIFVIMSTTSTAPRTSPTVYSTGQTPEDLLGLYDLAILSGTPLSELPIPPVLTDPNYIPPRYNQDLLNGFTIATATFTTVMISIRVYVRTKQSRGRFSMDDYCLAVGYLMMLSQWILVLVGVNNYQWGYHTYDMKLSSLLFDYKILYVYEVIFTCTLVMVRLSLLFFLGRLFREASRSFTILNNTLIVCNILFAIASVFAYTFQCSDVRAAWDVYVKFKTGCKPLYIYYIISAFQLALDFASVLAPIRLVNALSGLSLRKKMEVLAMFSLGLSACVISIARCFYLAPIVEDLDQSDASVNITICCQLEGTVAIVAACVPAARQFFSGLSSEPKVVHITGKVVKSFRSMTTSTSSASKCSSVMLSSSTQSRSQIGRGEGAVGDLDSQLLQSHYGRILGTAESMEMGSSVGGSANFGSRRGLQDDKDVEAIAGLEGELNEEKDDKNIQGRRRVHWGRHLSISRLKFNHHGSRYSPASSPSSSNMEFKDVRSESPALSIPPTIRVEEIRPGLLTNPSFESTGSASGVNSSTNSLDLSHWDTLDSIDHTAALTPRPSSSGRPANTQIRTQAQLQVQAQLQDWRDSVRID
ncbi:hypothetical protein TWF730_000035 [Orbilia blumenaviensis]|uniref:Rhodopsin domain-containing protein n=1 Tax=Orbilia blumenaviensis TaxID=1796055 RepID=A0AAV9VKK2_9PEZI